MLLADVTFCGGGPTANEDTSADARNYIGIEKFSLQGMDNSPLQQGPPGVEPLYSTTLAQGECTDGAIGFMIPLNPPTVGVTLRYSNTIGDQVDWRP